MMNTKRAMKLLWNLLLSSLALCFTVFQYNENGFTYGYAVILVLCAGVVSSQMLIFYRRAGSLPAWAVMAALFAASLLLTKDRGTGLLIGSLSLSIPLAVSLFWPRYRGIKELTKAALPAAGLFTVLGTLGYNYFHFGFFSFRPMVERTTAIVGEMMSELSDTLLKLYPKETAQQLQQMIEEIGKDPQIWGYYAFSFMAMIAYALFGFFFAAVFFADQKAQKEGTSRWCGSWSALIPTRGISWLFMIGQLFSAFFEDEVYLPMTAALNLFGFFYVFTALYRLERYLARKRWNGLLRGALVTLLFVLSYFSAGSEMFTAYTILLFVGWWIATSPKRPPVRK